MSHNLLVPSASGFRIIGDNFEFIIDPGDEILKSPDAFLVSSLHSFNRSLYNHNIPIFVSEAVKKLAMHPCPADAFIVGCIPAKKQSLRRNGKRICDFTFIEACPESNVIIIKVNNDTIVYTSGTLPRPEAIPPCNTLIMNTGKQAPITSIMNMVNEFTVEISDYSHFFEVINIFNSQCTDNTVGIDHTAMEAACLYLKNNYTVFSKAIKPLSQYKNFPPIIITTDRSLYPTRPAIPDTLFFNRISLSQIYDFSSHINATNIIAYCYDFEGKRERGNITIAGNNTIFQI